MNFSSRWVKFLFILGMLGVFPQASLTAKTSDLILKEAFISKHPLKNRPSGGYFILQNKGAGDRVLSSISSEQASNIEMHETLKENGIMKMVKRDEMIIPAGGQLAFQQGGKHLMIFGITTEGDHLSVVLTFKNGETLNHDFPLNSFKKK